MYTESCKYIHVVDDVMIVTMSDCYHVDDVMIITIPGVAGELQK